MGSQGSGGPVGRLVSGQILEWKVVVSYQCVAGMRERFTFSGNTVIEHCDRSDL
jgi:hypothetical protein